jgi:hypothetical protein
MPRADHTLITTIPADAAGIIGLEHLTPCHISLLLPFPRCGTLITAPALSPYGPEAGQRFQTSSDSIHCSCFPSDSVTAILMTQSIECCTNILSLLSA